MEGILRGIRVLDMTTVIAGPFATQMLGDYGADVVKIERPGGDTVRYTGAAKSDGMSGMFLNNNRNKRSIVLDLKVPSGRDALLRLVSKCDVFVHNTRPKAMRRLNLCFDTLRAANPNIIHVGIVGYGQAGPYAAFPAYDDMIQAAVALPWLAKRAGSISPRYMPIAIADRVASLATVNAVLAALLKRISSRDAQDIEVPMFETMAQLVLSDHLSGRTYLPPVSGAGYSRLLSPWRQPFETSDGVICALIYNDRNWQDFLSLAGKADLFRTDPRFRSITARTEHIDELYEIATDIFRQRSTAEWRKMLADVDIPVMPFIDLDDLCEDPHLLATGAIVESTHPTEGSLQVVAPSVRWGNASPFEVEKPAPHLGEHGREVLLEAAFTDAEIASLVTSGAVRLHERDSKVDLGKASMNFNNADNTF
jgi:crotonobetainyl-CoA:carnitine CoA-transferase CaiB-like acyl-CoA transferase